MLFSSSSIIINRSNGDKNIPDARNFGHQVDRKQPFIFQGWPYSFKDRGNSKDGLIKKKKKKDI